MQIIASADWITDVDLAASIKSGSRMLGQVFFTVSTYA